ncbi:MAG TPA: PadR family transcriptional regulator [Vicinamibacterales bacterium]|jgi:transcriptional regulator|nr:PadR family transcriptional regulator [Vicinamibacterales bacterium]
MADQERVQLLQGTLDLLVLQTLALGPVHGHGIATSIQHITEKELLVDHGSLYPALQRLERASLITSEWGISENNRRARYYTLSRAGRKRLVTETRRWEATVRVISRVLNPRSAT